MAETVQLDVITQRPRTPNDQYTVLTERQITNMSKETSPHFHVIKANAPSNIYSMSTGKPERSPYYVDRFTQVTHPHLIRGTSRTQPFGWIDHQWSRYPPQKYDTCHERASARWGQNKSGERTRSHNFGESIDRYTTIDMYRRPPTNYEGRVVMDCGRPADGYYAQRYPSRTTWFGSSVPLNRTNILDTIHRKTYAQYEEVKRAEQLARDARKGDWPEYSEYTDKFTLQTKVEPPLSGLEQRKRHLLSAKLTA